jgi:hypothetical protein
MAIDDSDPFEQGKRAKFNSAPGKNPEPQNSYPQNPYPKGSEQHQRWEAGYKFVEQGLAAV